MANQVDIDIFGDNIEQFGLQREEKFQPSVYSTECRVESDPPQFATVEWSEGVRDRIKFWPGRGEDCPPACQELADKTLDTTPQLSIWYNLVENFYVFLHQSFK